MPAKLLAKQKGEWAEVCFAAEILRRGWRIARPYGDSAPYDCVVDAGAGFRRVQVKAAFCGIPKARCPYRIALVHGYWKQLRYSPREVDLLAVLIVPRKAWFIVPTSAIEGLTILTFGKTRRSGGRMERYCEAWELFKKQSALSSQPSGNVPQKPFAADQRR